MLNRNFKVPVARRWCYTIYFDEVVGVGTFAHATITTKWNKLVRQMFRSGWHLVTTAHGGPIHAYVHDPQNDKLKKFLKTFGFTKHEVHEDQSETWIWRTK